MHAVTVKPEAVFQALADPTRIHIVRLFAEAGDEISRDEFLQKREDLSRK